MTASAHPHPIPESLRPVHTTLRGVEAHHVVRFMAARGTRVVVVLGGLRPVGIVTARDLADRVAGGGLSETLTKVESAMSSPLVTIGEWGSVVDAIATMNRHSVGHLPIVSANGYLVSLITLDDAQRLRDRGVTALSDAVRTSVIVPMVRRNAWKRMVHETQQRIRDNRRWWVLAVGVALAGALLALALGRSWIGFQTYQPKDYEPKDLPRRQYEESREKARSQQPPPSPAR